MENPLKVLHDHFEARQLWNDKISLKRGEYLHRAGERDAAVYYVKSGTIYFSVFLEEEREQVIRFGYAGNFVTAVDTFMSGGPTVFDSKALQRCELNVIDRATYRKAIAESPVLYQPWQAIISGLFMGQLEREIDLLTTDANERYRRVWERSPQLFQEVPAKYIANYLRMSPETLSRIRAQFGVNS